MVRVKCRYIVCKMKFGGRKTVPELVEDVIYKTVIKEVQALHGDFTLSSLRVHPHFSVSSLNVKTNIVIFRCQRELLKLVQSSLPFVKMIANVEMSFHTLHVAGTIRSCMKFIVRHYKTQLPILLRECSTEEERKRVKALIVESCQQSSRAIGFMERAAVS